MVDAEIVHDEKKNNLPNTEKEETKSDALDAHSDKERKEVKDRVKVEKVIATDSGAKKAPKSVTVILEIEIENVNSKLTVPPKAYFRRFEKPKVAGIEEPKMEVVGKSKMEEALERSVTELVAKDEVPERNSLFPLLLLAKWK